MPGDIAHRIGSSLNAALGQEHGVLEARIPGVRQAMVDTAFESVVEILVWSQCRAYDGK